MNDEKYYGAKDHSIVSYLEFGEIDLVKGKKEVWDFRLHQQAYDWLMLGRYATDLLTYIKMADALHHMPFSAIFEMYNKEVHHGDDASSNLAKLIGIGVTTNTEKPSSFFELGQTIFGCIEGIAFYHKLLEKQGIEFPKIGLSTVEWYGMDISVLFNQLSVRMHQDLKIWTMCALSDISDSVDVFFSKGITLLYSIRSLGEFFDMINKGRCSIFDYSFSIGRCEDTTIGSGKTVRYLNLNDVIKEYRKYEKVMYVNKQTSKKIPETNRVWLYCLYAEKSLCDEYIKMEKRIRCELFRRLGSIPEAERFLNKEIDPEWIPIDEFINSLK